MPCSNDQVNADPKQILVVDDEEAIVRIISSRLGLKGYEVKGSTNPLEALKLFSAWPEYWDLVITDMIMPSMTGVKLAEEMLKIRSDLPIIVCSGYCTISPQEALKIGVFKYLPKPLDFNELDITIEKALKRYR